MFLQSAQHMRYVLAIKHILQYDISGTVTLTLSFFAGKNKENKNMLDLKYSFILNDRINDD